jgi:hypothetical protein
MAGASPRRSPCSALSRATRTTPLVCRFSFLSHRTVYIVYEKTWNCNEYPPDGQVTFYDIKVEYDNVQVCDAFLTLTAQVTPTWTTSYVDDNCNNRAHVLNRSPSFSFFASPSLSFPLAPLEAYLTAQRSRSRGILTVLLSLARSRALHVGTRSSGVLSKFSSK